MQIRIEIDVKPEELRRFLGLPDVIGLQEDLVNFLRDKLGSAAETLDPSTFVKDNLETLKSSVPWQMVMQATRTSARIAESTGKRGARRIRKVASAAVAAVAGVDPAPVEAVVVPVVTALRKPRSPRRKATVAKGAAAKAPRKRRAKPMVIAGGDASD